jgi:hypothetical protein
MSQVKDGAGKKEEKLNQFATKALVFYLLAI